MASSAGPGSSNPPKAENRLVTAGHDTKAQRGFANPPVVRGSTGLDPTADGLHAHRADFRYGRFETPTTMALLSVLTAGDHLLVCNNVHQPGAALRAAS